MCVYVHVYVCVCIFLCVVSCIYVCARHVHVRVLCGFFLAALTDNFKILKGRQKKARKKFVENLKNLYFVYDRSKYLSVKDSRGLYLS